MTDIPDTTPTQEPPVMSSDGWAWADYERHAFRHVYPNEAAVRMCSPDGFSGAERRGEGRVCRVVISAVDA